MKRRLCAAVLCATLTLYASPAPGAPPPAPAQIIQAVLTNGLHVIVARDPVAPVVVTYIRYGAGSDEEMRPGQAHALEHMMFRGTSDVSAAQFADIMARTGGTYDAQTTNDATSYYFVVPSRYLGVVLRLEADRMRKASLKQGDWEAERGAIEQEVRADESSPSFAFDQRLRDALYAGTPYARDALGTAAGFDTMTAADLRAFYDRWYRPNDATLVIAGDVDPQATLAMVKARFGAIPQSPLPQKPAIRLAALPTTPVVGTGYLSTGASGFAVRYPGVDSPDYAAATVAVDVLNDPGGALADLNAGGKLNGARAYSSTGPSVSLAAVQANVPQGSDSKAVAQLLDQTIASILKNGVSSDAVGAVKREIVANQAFALTSIPLVASAWASASSLGMRSPDALLGRYEAVTTSDVNRVLRKYFGADRLPFTLVASKQAPPRPVDVGGGENVAYKGSEKQPLPAWAARAFREPLSPPSVARVRRYILPNGIRLVVAPLPIAPVVMLRGSIENNQTLYEPADKQGVAELTNSLMQWGTTTLDRKAFAAASQAIPAFVAGGTTFAVQARAKDFDRALALLAQEMLHPAFPQTALETIKQDAVPSVTAAQKLPGWLALLALDSGLYPPSDPVRTHPTGASVQNVNIGDVRAWYAKAFRPDLTSVVVVGDVSPAYVRAEIVKYFGSWRPSGPAPTFKYPALAPNRASKAMVPSPIAVQQSVQLGETMRVLESNPDAPALELANAMLTGEGAASILFDDLRTRRGYVYDVGSTLDIGIQRSTYTFRFASDPKNADMAASRLLADLRSLQTTPVSAADLARAKSSILARSALALDSYGGVAAALLAGIGTKRSFNAANTENVDAWKHLLGVTPASLRAAFAKWVRVGDFARVDVVPASPSPNPSSSANPPGT
ncbi:MAG TPA: pitrilysin family protein [Candidatus Baltobacteraceae bacterium]